MAKEINVRFHKMTSYTCTKFLEFHQYFHNSCEI